MHALCDGQLWGKATCPASGLLLAVCWCNGCLLEVLGCFDVKREEAHVDPAVATSWVSPFPLFWERTRRKRLTFVFLCISD